MSAAKPAPLSTHRVRLLTYNTHGCIGIDGRYDAERTLRVIAHARADIVALQEVYQERLPERDFLAKLTTLPYPYIRYGYTLEHATRGSYGNVLLSKWPIEDFEEIDLNIPAREPRGAIRAIVEHPEQTIDIVATHLGLDRTERSLQLAKLVAQWEIGKPKYKKAMRVLMGDLNEWLPHSLFLEALQGLFRLPPSFQTFPSSSPTFALDRILVRPIRALQSISPINTRNSRQASDHLPLLADLSLSAIQRTLV